MGFAHLVSNDTVIEAFKGKYHIPLDIFIEYCLEGNIGLKSAEGRKGVHLGLWKLTMAEGEKWSRHLD